MREVEFLFIKQSFCVRWKCVYYHLAGYNGEGLYPLIPAINLPPGRAEYMSQIFKRMVIM